jgi:hypothetical protein
VPQLADDVADLVHDVAERAKELHAIGVPSAEWLSAVGHRFGPRVQGVLGWSAPYVAPVLDILLGMAPGEMANGMASDTPFTDGLMAGVRSSISRAAAADAADAKLPPLMIKGPTSDDLEEAVEHARYLMRESLKPDAVIDPQLLNLATCFLGLDAGLPRLTENGHVRRMKDVIGRLFGEAPKMTNPDGSVDASQAPAMDVHILLRGAPMQFSGILSTTPEGTLKLLTPVPAQGANKPCMIEQFFDYSDVASVALVREVKASAVGSRIITS